MDKRKFSYLGLLILAGLAVYAASCTTFAVPLTSGPTPTSHTLFSNRTQSVPESSGNAPAVAAPTLSSLFQPGATITPKPTRTPRPTTTPVPMLLPTLFEDPLEEVVIYDEVLNENWVIFEPSEMEYNLAAVGPSYAGQYALEATSRGSFSRLLFAVRPAPEENYPRNNVLALNFMLYSGKGYIKTSDLVVTILGSNSFSFYVENDTSVSNNYEPVFSETRLYYLGINHDIPPETWVEVIVPLDDLIYDPNYHYVTGFFIKNDAGFNHAFRIDQVKLILINPG